MHGFVISMDDGHHSIAWEGLGKLLYNVNSTSFILLSNFLIKFSTCLTIFNGIQCPFSFLSHDFVWNPRPLKIGYTSQEKEDF